MTFYVFDLDGTLALNHHRNHFLRQEKECECVDGGWPMPNCDTCGGKGKVIHKDWNAFNLASKDDAPHTPIIELATNLIFTDHRVEIWSGRDDMARGITEEWLEKHGIPREHLTRMREHGDYTEDSLLKLRWLQECGKDRPEIVFDDRNRVVTMWRENGVCCCQVADGPF